MVAALEFAAPETPHSVDAVNTGASCWLIPAGRPDSSLERRYSGRPPNARRHAHPFARARTCVRSSVMWLAGIPVADRAVLQLAVSLREAELIFAAERLKRAYDLEARIVALDIPDREAILRVLEEAPTS